MHIIKIIISIFIAQLAGIIGSFFTASSVQNWYVTLIKPSFSPPNWIFGPVWIFLYTLIGISAYLIWDSEKTKERKTALWIYGIHLILNALWSIIFFGLKSPGWAFLEIIILLIFILITTKRFWEINKWAGILLLPYIAWVSFASILNYFIWQLN